MTAHALIPNRSGTDFLRIEYRPGTPDEAVLREIFLGDAYHLDGIAPDINGGIVIDVGAHIGCVTLACLDRGARKVISIEPNRANRELLEHNCEKPAEIWAFAVGDGTPLVSRGESATAVTVADVGGHASATFADVLALAESAGLGEDERIALLKVDVEGAEFEWFGTATPDMLDRVNRIAMEWHGTGTGHTEIVASAYGHLLRKLAYTHAVSVFGHPERGGMLYAHPYR